MSSEASSFAIRAALGGFLTVAAFSISLGSTAAAAANGDQYTMSHRHHRAHYVSHQRYGYAQGEALPYGPEYGFLSRVPADAIRMPGYTFVPGVGILGESCDLPTSACPNEYRDVK